MKERRPTVIMIFMIISFVHCLSELVSAGTIGMTLTFAIGKSPCASGV